MSGGSFTCALPLAEGANAVRAEASDRLAHTGESEPRTLHLDTIPPELLYADPAPGSPWPRATVTVKGEVRGRLADRVGAHRGAGGAGHGDDVHGGGGAGGDGPEVSLAGEAEDAAGNVGRAALSLVVDRQPPTVAITSSRAGRLGAGPAGGGDGHGRRRRAALR